MKKGYIPNYEKMDEKYGHKRDQTVKALRADWSVGAIVRAYEIPEHVVRTWQQQEKIPPYRGIRKATPDVGAVLA